MEFLIDFWPLLLIWLFALLPLPFMYRCYRKSRKANESFGKFAVRMGWKVY